MTIKGANPPPLQDEDIVEWYRRWGREQWKGCGCPNCMKLRVLADIIIRINDGEPYDPSMLLGLEPNLRNKVLQTVLLRTLGADK